MNIKWDAKDYTDRFSFVHQYGENVMELIEQKPGSFVVDLGCGNGALSEKLQERGYRVLGLDASEDMIQMAQQLHPNVKFRQADAKSFRLEKPADVIFSNAVFHWIDADKQEQMLQNIAGQLKRGGELVCEFGGKGCGETVHKTLEKNFQSEGLIYPRVFYFPTIGEYTPMLEKAGLKVNYAILFDRPTVQEGKDGLENWIRMFVKKPFEGVEEKLKNQIISKTVEDLKSVLLQEGKWIVDYVRIRLRAKKEG